MARPGRMVAPPGLVMLPSGRNPPLRHLDLGLGTSSRAQEISRRGPRAAPPLDHLVHLVQAPTRANPQGNDFD
jgi:hypothetical protein